MLGSLKIAQIVSLIMIIVGIVLFIKGKTKSRFENNYKEAKVDAIKF